MKYVKINLEDDDMVFHRQSIFQEGDELVVFSQEEFSKFRSDLKEFIENALNITEESLLSISQNSPSTDALRILNWIKKMEDEIEKMDKTDIQKNLLSFR